MKSGLIQQLLQQLFPKVIFIDATVLVSSDTLEYEKWYKDVCSLKSKGEICPIIIFGFTQLSRLQARLGGTIFDTPGIFYLHLPTDLLTVEMFIKKVNSTKRDKSKKLDKKSLLLFKMDKIRRFKHSCDNLWMALKTNLNLARKQANGTIYELKSTHVEKLIKQYKRILPLVSELAIDKNNQIPHLFNAAATKIRSLDESNVTLPYAISLVQDSVEDIQNISNILNKVKKIYTHE